MFRIKNIYNSLKSIIEGKEGKSCINALKYSFKKKNWEQQDIDRLERKQQDYINRIKNLKDERKNLKDERNLANGYLESIRKLVDNYKDNSTAKADVYMLMIDDKLRLLELDKKIYGMEWKR